MAAVKAVFRELEMDRRFVEYEESSSAEIQRLIQDLPESLPVALFQGTITLFLLRNFSRRNPVQLSLSLLFRFYGENL